jgi:hypothetical protein
MWQSGINALALIVHFRLNLEIEAGGGNQDMSTIKGVNEFRVGWLEFCRSAPLICLD